MGKKRRTRQEKIILRLKRELARLDSARQAEQKQPSAPKSTKPKSRQEAIYPPPPARLKKPIVSKKSDASIFFYDPKLVKRDLLKTLALAFLILASEFVLYWKLR